MGSTPKSKIRYGLTLSENSPRRDELLKLSNRLEFIDAMQGKVSSRICLCRNYNKELLYLEHFILLVVSKPYSLLIKVNEKKSQEKINFKVYLYLIFNDQAQKEYDQLKSLANTCYEHSCNLNYQNFTEIVTKIEDLSVSYTNNQIDFCRHMLQGLLINSDKKKMVEIIQNPPPFFSVSEEQEKPTTCKSEENPTRLYKQEELFEEKKGIDSTRIISYLYKNHVSLYFEFRDQNDEEEKPYITIKCDLKTRMKKKKEGKNVEKWGLQRKAIACFFNLQRHENQNWIQGLRKDKDTKLWVLRKNEPQLSILKLIDSFKKANKRVCRNYIGENIQPYDISTNNCLCFAGFLLRKLKFSQPLVAYWQNKVAKQISNCIQLIERLQEEDLINGENEWQEKEKNGEIEILS